MGEQPCCTHLKGHLQGRYWDPNQTKFRDKHCNRLHIQKKSRHLNWKRSTRTTESNSWLHMALSKKHTLCLRALSTHSVNSSRTDALTTSLWNLLRCPAKLLVKNLFLVSNLSDFHILEKRASPIWHNPGLPGGKTDAFSDQQTQKSKSQPGGETWKVQIKHNDSLEVRKQCKLRYNRKKKKKRKWGAELL